MIRLHLTQMLPLGPPPAPPPPQPSEVTGNFSPTPHTDPRICRARVLCPGRSPKPRGDPHTRRPEPRTRDPIPQDHNMRSGGAPPARPVPHLQRRSITGRTRSRVQRGHRRLQGRRAESAPSTRGRRGASCSRSGSRTSSISRRSPASHSHPGPGAGWGRGVPPPAPPRPWRSLWPEPHSKASGQGWHWSATP